MLSAIVTSLAEKTLFKVCIHDPINIIIPNLIKTELFTIFRYNSQLYGIVIEGDLILGIYGCVKSDFNAKLSSLLSQHEDGHVLQISILTD